MLHPGPAVQKPEPYPGARLLRAADPTEVYHRLRAGDPLRVEERAGRWLRDQAYLIDVNRMQEEAIRWLAVTSMTYRGNPELGEWIDERFDFAAAHLIREDIEVHMKQGVVPCPDPDDEVFDPRWEFMVDTFGLLPSVAIGAAVRFNCLGFTQRKAFFLLAMECISVQQCLDDGWGPKETLRKNVQVACEALLGEPLNLGKPIQPKKKKKRNKRDQDPGTGKRPGQGGTRRDR